MDAPHSVTDHSVTYKIPGTNVTAEVTEGRWGWFYTLTAPDAEVRGCIPLTDDVADLPHTTIAALAYILRGDELA